MNTREVGTSVPTAGNLVRHAVARATSMRRLPGTLNTTTREDELCHCALITSLHLSNASFSKSGDIATTYPGEKSCQVW